MRAHLLLADSAQTDPNGKIHALGIGWSSTITPTPPAAVIALIELEWHETNSPFTFHIELVSADGEPVMGQGPTGALPIVIQGELEGGRPPGTVAGSKINMPISFNVTPGLLLQAGQRYEWRLTVGSDVHEVAPFTVRNPPILVAPGPPPGQ